MNNKVLNIAISIAKTGAYLACAEIVCEGIVGIAHMVGDRVGDSFAKVKKEHDKKQVRKDLADRLKKNAGIVSVV